MLDLKFIVNNVEYVKKNLSKRFFDLSIIDKVVILAQKRSKYLNELQNLESIRNFLSKEIAKNTSDFNLVKKLTEEVLEIKKQIEKLVHNETKNNEKLTSILLFIPNLLKDDVHLGKDDKENIVINEHKNLGNGLVKNVKPHYEIAKSLDIVDFERSVKMSGARFWTYKGLGSKLLRALENFMLDEHIKKGYVELTPPLIVNASIMQGTGQLPKFKDDLFKIEGRDQYLIPTAEVPLTNFFANEIINLPMYFTAFTPCFRAEAGSGGRDTKGLIRAHQFNKVELVKLVTHETLEEEYLKMLNDAKNILNLLELPFREVKLCSGDTGFSSEKTIDLEVWIPSEEKYREISSVSSFGDFQGRRTSIRYKNKEGKNVPICTINGSGLAIDRTIAAILENYQNDKGEILIPKVLIKYMGVEKIGNK